MALGVVCLDLTCTANHRTFVKVRRTAVVWRFCTGRGLVLQQWWKIWPINGEWSGSFVGLTMVICVFLNSAFSWEQSLSYRRFSEEMFWDRDGVKFYEGEWLQKGSSIRVRGLSISAIPFLSRLGSVPSSSPLDLLMKIGLIITRDLLVEICTLGSRSSEKEYLAFSLVQWNSYSINLMCATISGSCLLPWCTKNVAKQQRDSLIQ